MRPYPVFLILLILLAACVLPGQGTPIEPPTSALPPEPTLSPTPEIPLVILVLPADMPQEQYDLYQATIYELAQEAGMRFQVRNTLAQADLDMERPALKVVIAFPPDPGLADLASAAPEVQFLGVGIPGLTPAANLSLIGASGSPIDRQAFLAGYMAAMLALDYHAGIIYEEDTPNGLAARDAFINGYHFYCGLCNPAFPPYYDYPITVKVPPDSAKGQMAGFADILIDRQVEVAYVHPKIATPELLDYLAQYNVKLIGETLPLESLRPNWVASIQPQVIPAIQAIWPDLLAGKGGQEIPMPLFLTDINPELLTPGKQRVVEEVLSDLQAGYIGTGLQP